MKNILSISILFITLFNLLIGSSFAQYSLPKGKMGTGVMARVGHHTLNISGFISPFASIVLTTLDGVFMRSGVADKDGKFYMSEILIKKGFNGFCLTAIDFKRLGESVTCVNIPPADRDIDKNDLFLPPTIALVKKQIVVGGRAVVIGYTMPGALVTIHLNDGRTVNVRADNTGYYRYEIADLKAGAYKLYPTAELERKESLVPTKQIELNVVSTYDQATIDVKYGLKDALERFTSIGFGILWIALLLFLIILILLWLLWKRRRKREEEEGNCKG